MRPNKQLFGASLTACLLKFVRTEITKQTLDQTRLESFRTLKQTKLKNFSKCLSKIPNTSQSDIQMAEENIILLYLPSDNEVPVSSVPSEIDLNQQEIFEDLSTYIENNDKISECIEIFQDELNVAYKDVYGVDRLVEPAPLPERDSDETGQTGLDGSAEVIISSSRTPPVYRAVFSTKKWIFDRKIEFLTKK